MEGWVNPQPGELGAGIEPRTCCMMVHCSTNCAILARIKVTSISSKITEKPTILTSSMKVIVIEVSFLQVLCPSRHHNKLSLMMTFHWVSAQKSISLTGYLKSIPYKRGWTPHQMLPNHKKSSWMRSWKLLHQWIKNRHCRASVQVSWWRRFIEWLQSILPM